MRLKLLLLTSLCLLSLLTPALSVEGEMAVDEQHRGAVEIEKGYHIFPEGRIGNSLYFEKKLIVTDPKLMIFGVTQSPEGYIYAGVDENGDFSLHIIGEDAAYLKGLGMGYYQYRNRKGISKLYRLIEAEKVILELLPRSSTANGLTIHESGRAAFYHISSGQTIQDEEGKTRYEYSFRIHILNADQKKIQTLANVIKDYAFPLNLKWISQKTLQYTLSDGQTSQLDIP